MLQYSNKYREQVSERFNPRHCLLFKMTVKRLWLCLAVLFATGLGVYAFLKPVYDFDMLAYAAIFYKADGMNAEERHRKIYDEVLPSLGTKTAEFLTENEHEKRCRDSYSYFDLQLPFYTIKPLYNGLIYPVAKVAGDPILAMRIISSVSYVGLILSLFIFLSSRLHGPLALLFATILSCMPVIHQAARMMTPDMLSTFVVFGALVFFLLRNRYYLSVCVLILSVLIRPDNAALALAAIPCWLIGNKEKAIKPIFAIGGAVLTIVLYFAVAYFGNAYGWKVTFQYYLISLDVPIQQWQQTPLTFEIYLQRMGWFIARYQLLLIHAVFIGMLSFFAVRSLLSNKVFDKRLGGVWLVLFIGAAAKYFLIPRFDPRYYVLQFVFALALMVLVIVPKKKAAFLN